MHHCPHNNALSSFDSPLDDMTQPPNITEPPEDIFAELFKPINLTCNAVGNPIYHWERDDVLVAMISDTVFEIAEVRPEDRGRYRCLAKNNAGTAVSASALVTIQGQFINNPSCVNSCIYFLTGLYQYLVTIASNNVTVNSTGFIGNVNMTYTCSSYKH